MGSAALSVCLNKEDLFNMAVPKYKRDVAPAEFVRNASRLEAMTGKMCARLPKRWSFTRTRYITDCANSILDHAVRANVIWVTTEEEAALRMNHLMEAYASCYTLLRKIDMIEEEMPHRVIDNVNPDGTTYKTEAACFSKNMIQEWTNMITMELKLLKGTINSDRKRYAAKRRRHLVKVKKSPSPPSIYKRKKGHKKCAKSV